MTDRELLELAAKAAGIKSVSEGGLYPNPCRDIGACIWWDPFTNDCDALRLAVKLRMLVDVMDGQTFAQLEGSDWITQDHDCDPRAATRRAIVRAAAEIGRNMP